MKYSDTRRNRSIYDTVPAQAGVFSYRRTNPRLGGNKQLSCVTVTQQGDNDFSLNDICS